jgi:hypothetical protein
MTFRLSKRWVGLLMVLAVLGSARKALAKYEQEQLQLEGQLQQRIENILAKALPPNSYLVTVKVEMEDRTTPTTTRTNTGGRRAGGNPFLGQNQFVLPGVPQKKDFVQQQEETGSETVVNSFAAETLVRRISITILVASDVGAEQIKEIRDIISASIPFNPLRGDELDIQNSPLLKKSLPAATSSTVAPSDRFQGRTGAVGSLLDRSNWPTLIAIASALVALSIFIIFLFGPVRAFLNRLLAVLPRIGEQAAYTVSNAAPKANTPGQNQAGGSSSGFGGANHPGGQAANADMPFNFIREDQLNKLPILFKQMSPSQSALVLAYLPPEWASRLLGGLETTVQTAIMSELSQAREVPPEIVKEVEAQVKGKLPYLVGGVDWIQSVYQLTQPQTQRALLGTLHQQSPELARTLRRKTFFFEDLAAITSGALRLLVQEIGYPTVAMSLKDEKAEFRETILRRLPAGTREIILQELELSADDKAAMIDAKTRLVVLGRRLLLEGRIGLPERKSA